ncbi:single-stranded DNA-binding protein [Thiorhodococcus minor]|uniref:Single-stranded DNA-binding protein n=1 Tax=Thiorhodococcus minor TaxID=57489 RepID=A0A6M0JVZ3_9GAMM|nr:single-stranded DNA-binding protein [Thiorhodococcus minor]NEV60355.1 single-stranded DNA-binding protein [Thiorhodococcus minor]
MSRSINKATLIGHLGADPEVRALPSGDAVANLSLATNETWTDKASGEARERTEWHRVVLFGRLAEIAAQYLHSGSRVYVEGKLRTRQYPAQDGGERSATEVVIDGGGTLLMLDGPADATAQPTRAPSSRGARQTRQHQATGSRGTAARGRERVGAQAVHAAAPIVNDAIPF